VNLPRIAAGIGAAVGGAFWFLSETDVLLAVPIWLIPVLVPGLVPLWPFMLLLGGAHGTWAGNVLLLTPLTNGYVYFWVAHRVGRWLRN
jgi:hypothetical protein